MKGSKNSNWKRVLAAVIAIAMIAALVLPMLMVIQ